MKKNGKVNGRTKEELVEQGVLIPEFKRFQVENLGGFSEYGGEEQPRYRDMMIRGFGIPPISFTPNGMPSTDIGTLQKLAGNPSKGEYGLAFDHFDKKGDPNMGKKLCFALEKHLKLKSIGTLLTNFIKPLQQAPDSKGRIHCSLNINTETGRLSARRPNLQNQPSQEKDLYKIRKAFTVEKGNKLIVADYG